MWLGSNLDDNKPYNIKSKFILTHGVCMGSTGSGKTFFCKVILEECIMDDIPVIIFDIHGDLLSMAIKGDQSKLAALGIDPKYFSKFWSKTIVRVFSTTDVSYGTHFTFDPITLPPKSIDSIQEPTKKDDALEAFYDDIAEQICNIIESYPRASKYLYNGDTKRAFLELLKKAYRTQQPISNISQLVALMEKAQPFSGLDFSVYIKDKDRQSVIHFIKNNILSGKAKKYYSGNPRVLVENLMKKGQSNVGTPLIPINIIDLSTISDEKLRMNYIASMLTDIYYYFYLERDSNELPKPKVVVFLDELHNFCPQGSVPTKKIIKKIVKEGRKFGIGFLGATQNPTDIENKIRDNLSTKFIGKITDPSFVEFIKSIGSGHADPKKLAEYIRNNKTGEFYIFESANQIVHVKSRYIMSKDGRSTETELKKALSSQGVIGTPSGSSFRNSNSKAENEQEEEEEDSKEMDEQEEEEEDSKEMDEQEEEEEEEDSKEMDEQEEEEEEEDSKEMDEQEEEEEEEDSKEMDEQEEEEEEDSKEMDEQEEEEEDSKEEEEEDNKEKNSKSNRKKRQEKNSKSEAKAKENKNEGERKMKEKNKDKKQISDDFEKALKLPKEKPKGNEAPVNQSGYENKQTQSEQTTSDEKSGFPSKYATGKPSVKKITKQKSEKKSTSRRQPHPLLLEMMNNPIFLGIYAFLDKLCSYTHGYELARLIIKRVRAQKPIEASIITEYYIAPEALILCEEYSYLVQENLYLVHDFNKFVNKLIQKLQIPMDLSNQDMNLLYKQYEELILAVDTATHIAGILITKDRIGWPKTKLNTPIKRSIEEKLKEDKKKNGYLSNILNLLKIF